MSHAEERLEQLREDRHGAEVFMDVMVIPTLLRNNRFNLPNMQSCFVR